MFWRGVLPYRRLLPLRAGGLGSPAGAAAGRGGGAGRAPAGGPHGWRAGAPGRLAASAAGRRLVGPRRALSAGARRIAAGGFGHKVSPAGVGVVGELARSFNEMSARLAGQIAQLEADREQLRTILGGLVEGVVAIDAGQCIRFANDRAAELIDFSAPQSVGRR